LLLLLRLLRKAAAIEPLMLTMLLLIARMLVLDLGKPVENERELAKPF